MFENIKADYSRSTKKKFTLFNFLALCISSKGVDAVKNFRISHWFYKHNLLIFAKIFQNKNIKRNGCDIGYKASIGKGFAIGHPVGIVISSNAFIGENVTIMSGVTIGTKCLNAQNNGNPTIENNVYIGTGAKILGAVNIKEGSTIGANAVIVCDVDACSVWGGVPGKKIRGV